MRKKLFSISSLVVTVLALGLMVAHIAAQEATPTPITATGVGVGLLGSGLPDAAPDSTLMIRSAIFEPGGIVPAHTHPGALVLWIESGELTWAVIEGEAIVTRATVGEADAVVETIGAGTETILMAGDSVFEQGSVHIARNDGDVETVTYIASLSPTGEPLTHFVEQDA